MVKERHKAAIARRREFFESLAAPLALLDLFEYPLQVYLYLKDRGGRYVRANRVAREVMGVANEAQVIGKNDFDFIPPIGWAADRVRFNTILTCFTASPTPAACS